MLQDPEAGDRIPGAGGARKIRVPTKNKGKSGGYRTIYYDLSRRGEIYLLAIYLKKTQENISESEKKVIAKLIKVLNDL